MNDRHTVDSITSDQLDELYDERDELARRVATLAAITAEAARRGTISIDGIRNITREQQP